MTIAAVEAARRRGVIRDGDEVVALVTGNGLKTPDARRLGTRTRTPSARPGEPGLAPVLRPSLDAFEDWLEGASMSTVRIPPTLRTSRTARSSSRSMARRCRRSSTTSSGCTRASPAQLLGSDGSVNRFVNVFLNDTDVRHLDGLATAVGERDSVVLLPAMAGG